MKKIKSRPFNGSVSGGNGVTMSFDGIFTLEPSGLLALPELSPLFSVAKFRKNLEVYNNYEHLHASSF